MLRRIGLVVLIGGLALAAWEAWLWYGADTEDPFRLRALGEWWAAVDRDSLQLIAPAIERHVPGGPWLYASIIQPLLLWPLAVELFVLGLVLSVIGRIRL